MDKQKKITELLLTQLSNEIGILKYEKTVLMVEVQELREQLSQKEGE